MRIVPWKSNDELEYLKKWFYPNKFINEPDLRERAILKVRSYKTKIYYLPHVIDSTSQLTQCILFDESSNGSNIQIIKLSYTMSLIRFVNGMLDPTQQSQYAIPLHTLAEIIGFPSWFVELRHTGTHERDLPSLEMLRMMVNQSLEWLWVKYWNNDNKNEEENEIINLENKEEEFLEIFKEKIQFYKNNKIMFKKNDYLWKNNMILPDSPYGNYKTKEISPKEIFESWLQDLKLFWKTNKHIHPQLMKYLIENCDFTLVEIMISKIESFDFLLCQWLLINFNNAIKGNKDGDTIKRTFTSEKLLKFINRITMLINYKTIIYLWDYKWHELLKNEIHYLSLILLQSIKMPIHNLLKNDKKLRKKSELQDIPSHIQCIIDLMEQKGITKNELSLFDTNEPTSQLKRTIEAAQESQEILQDLNALKDRLKKLKRVDSKKWCNIESWSPKPFGCL